MLGTMLTISARAHPASSTYLPALARHGAAMQDVPEIPPETYQVFIHSA